MGRGVWLIALLILLSACHRAPPQQWITLAEAEQGRAPALYADGERLTAVWVGADQAGVHHDAHQWIGVSALTGALTPVTVLPLPPVYPYDQRIYAANDGAFHLLWLDRGQDQSGITLYGALIGADLSVQRTAPISDGLALRYAAIPDGSGGLWAAWSGGQLSELTLSTRHVDQQGRPLDTTRIAADAEFPAMLRTSGGDVDLFWIAGGQVMRARLQDGAAFDTASMTGAVSIAAGDRLVDFSAALDTTHAYLFWNISRANGTIETWFAAGRLDAPYWNAPTRMAVNLLDGQTADAGFQVNATHAEAGDVPLRWASPASGQYDVLPVAVESVEGVGIVYLRAGAIIGYQTVVPDVYLIGAPSLVVRADLSLVLAWSSPDAPRARLNLLQVP